MFFTFLTTRRNWSPPFGAKSLVSYSNRVSNRFCPEELQPYIAGSPQHWMKSKAALTIIFGAEQDFFGFFTKPKHSIAHAREIPEAARTFFLVIFDEGISAFRPKETPNGNSSRSGKLSPEDRYEGGMAKSRLTIARMLESSRLAANHLPFFRLPDIRAANTR